MCRVVCPVCKTGFEANISKSNCAINCVQCGVAFNASSFLAKSDSTPARRYTGPVLLNPPGPDTRTGGLPFSDPLNADFSAGDVGGIAVVEPQRGKPQASLEEATLPILVRSNPKGSGRLDAPKPGNVLIVRNSGEDKAGARNPAISPSPLAEPASKLSDKREPVLKPGPVLKIEQAKPLADVPSAAVKPAEAPRLRKRRQLLEGTFGKYEIEREIARGGVGAVFEARDRATGNVYALKVLIEGDDVGETERERFRHECETAKALSLPGMVQIHEVGEWEGRPFMVMELVTGKSLDKVIAERSLTVNDCLVLMKSVAATVGALHEAGYVHRDLKPGNILLDSFGSPKVADFGLVKSLDEITRMTASGLVCGTPAYMSPEQARGDGTAVDPRSDVWALGAVLYEMLAGEPPFKADNALRLMLRITKEQPRRLRSSNQKVPREVEAMVMKCLEKTASRRYANGKLLAADLTTFLEGGELRVGTQPKMRQLLDAAVKTRARLIPALAACALLGICALVYYAALSPKDSAPLVERGFQALADTSLTPAEKIARAQNSFNEAIALNPKNARAYLGLGHCLAQRGIDPVTHAVLNATLVKEAFRMNEYAAQLDPKLQVEALINAARYNMWLSDHVTQAVCMERAVKLEPANLKYRESLGMAYWHAGAQRHSPRYYRSAVATFQSILVARPDYPKVSDYIHQIQDKFLTQQSATVGMQ